MTDRVIPRSKVAAAQLRQAYVAAARNGLVKLGGRGRAEACEGGFQLRWVLGEPTQGRAEARPWSLAIFSLSVPVRSALPRRSRESRPYLACGFRIWIGSFLPPEARRPKRASSTEGAKYDSLGR